MAKVKVIDPLGHKRKISKADRKSNLILSIITLGILGAIVAIATFIPSNESDNSNNALKGEFWLIKDDNIPVMKIPEIPETEEHLLMIGATIITTNTKVQIIDRKTKGFSKWYKVNVYDEENEVYANGWILCETVKNAGKIE